MKAALVTLAAGLALLFSAGAASGGSPHHWGVGGVVRPQTHIPSLWADVRALTAPGTSGPLVYHGGPVMHTNTTYAIYWAPDGFADANYETLINRFFTDVAAASGSTTNVYSVATQYSDTQGPIKYQSTFGGAYTDSTAYPASGCDDGVDSVCLSDSQLQTEIQAVVDAEHWPTGLSSIFFIMLPPDVGVCYDGSDCSTTTFCAYHSAFGSVDSPDVYAVEPYDAALYGCNTGVSPNGDDADATINTISHEMNESISDPEINAWYSDDASGDEMADLCAWEFGTDLGGSGTSAYNEVINHDDYFLQMEYSNEGSTCLQSTSGLPPIDTAPPAISGTYAVDKVLTSTPGSWTGQPTGYAYQWQRCSSAGSGCVNIPGANSSTYTLQAADGGQTVRSTVSAVNANGTAAYVDSAVSSVIVPLPAATVAPKLSGTASPGRTLSTTTGLWNTPMTYAYQWLRCKASGGGCTAIGGAKESIYVVRKADGGHRLEVRVSATNASGTTAALSNRTAVVAVVPAPVHAPRISGKAKVGRTLRAARGTWSGSPTRFAYQWLRCSSRGTRCTKVARATKPTYRAASRDVGHRLRLRVTARNAAGSTTATSKPTAEIHA